METSLLVSVAHKKTKKALTWFPLMYRIRCACDRDEIGQSVLLLRLSPISTEVALCTSSASGGEGSLDLV